MPSLPVKVQPLTKRKAWNALAAHFNQARNLHLRDLFAQDPKRGERMTLEAAGLYLDYSKNRITDETLKLLFQLATESGLRDRIDAMFRGDKINVTEKRAVLHVRCGRPKRPASWWMARTSCRRSMKCWSAWRILRSGSAAAPGRATRGNGFAMSSTSALAAQTSVRLWPTKRFGTTASATWSSGSFPMWTALISSKPPATWTRLKRSSSSPRKPLRRWRP